MTASASRRPVSATYSKALAFLLEINQIYNLTDSAHGVRALFEQYVLPQYTVEELVEFVNALKGNIFIRIEDSDNPLALMKFLSGLNNVEEEYENAEDD